MSDRIVRIALVALVVLLAVFVAQPVIMGLLFSAQAPRTVAARGDLAPVEQSTVALFEKAAPSVVHVFAQPDPRRQAQAMMDFDEDGGQGQGQGGEGQGSGVQTGTGFVWDAAGHIVTNNHVVAGAGSIAVRLVAGETIPARVVGTAPNYDLAVLQLQRLREMPPPLALGTSGNLKVGQSTFAIGNPFGLDHTLTTGVVSALRRRLPTSAGRELSDVIQTDAAINPGNSGGPLLDSAGRLVGVNTAIFSPSGASAGIGFAIPVDVVNRVVPALIKDGRTPNPGIGIVAAPEAATARYGIDGVVVVRVQRGSPAASAGLAGLDPMTGTIGDIIVGANGEPVHRLADLTRALEGAGIGAKVDLAILRDGNARTVRVAVADVPPASR